MRQDLFDMMDDGADRAIRDGRDPSVGVQEVLTEAAVLATKGILQPTGRAGKKLEKEARIVLPEAERPQRFPHFRRAHEWQALLAAEAGAAAAAQGPPDFFFSKRAWDAVFGISSEVVELARTLQLPRPSRIQNMTFYDLVGGCNVVIADQAGSGKTLAYLFPLLQRHVFKEQHGSAAPQQGVKVKLLILSPTSDLAEQIVSVARVVSTRSGRPFRVHCCTGGHPAHVQRQNLLSGTDVLVATPGRLKYFMFEDPSKALDLSECQAVVFDEVDVLMQEDASLTMDDLRQKLVTKIQWVFVTATLAEVARQRLRDFEALPSVTPIAEPGGKTPKKGLVWHTGPGLHKVSPMCEHVLVDCTPENLHDLPSEARHRKVMKEKTLALAWHLQHGVLSKLEENRLVVFCNTIENCRLIENELRKMDPKDKRSGARCWKVLVLHGLRDKDDYRAIAEEFNGDRTKAADFFKKKLLVCTDRLSRGIDFSRQPVNWVVLLDWPRDATEYLRRVGRTARGGGRGGVLSFVSGVTELKMAKQVTSAAIRSVPLQSESSQETGGSFGDNFRVLERFDPLCKDWRAPEAAAPKPRGKKEVEEEEEEPEEPAAAGGAAAAKASWQRAEGAWRGARDGRGAAADAENSAAVDGWAPWAEEKWDGKKGVPWEEGDGDFLDDDDDDDVNMPGGRVGISLSD